MPKKYTVTLTAEECRRLEQMVRSGRTRARPPAHARALLKANCGARREGLTDERISEAVMVGRATIEPDSQELVGTLGRPAVPASLHKEIRQLELQR